MVRGRCIGIIGCLILVVAVITQQNGVAAVTYTVGDDLGWTIPPNASFYITWASNKTFHQGDELVFIWSGLGSHTVGVPTADEYENCSQESGYGNSPVHFPLFAGTHYFMCTVDDHCERGQKFSINVTESEAPTPAGFPWSPPTSSASSMSAAGVLFFAAAMSTLLGSF
ncbi:hypothetical protein FNV43_RR04163 [Rhamnella rubrinervis]|uniref:Phytocyanin domain-containing protein n=1 Tax=Rhamnella rubrinervis TaxID=2594499 RepID=A0A8K0HJ23_9ROSA|nr:hypothetical protein FNV43_RR04163 [Rhamnella rubrinervis]